MNINILIVDDKEENLMVLEDVLDDLTVQNINIISALDAHKALEIALSRKIDLIISDIQMPNINGFEMAKILKDIKKTRNIPIIFLTAAFKAEEFIDKGYEVGAIDYFLKPIERYSFLNKINMYIQLFQKEKVLQNQLELINKQQEQLIDQSRFASMGEMISMIAHQWRQPLSSMAGIVAPLDLKYKMGMEIDPKDAISRFARQNEVVQHLSRTIEDFLGFFKDTGYDELISIKQIIETPQRLMSSGLKQQNVDFEVVYTIDKETQFQTKPSKFDQVLMNIYKNALDEFKSKDIKEPKLIVVTTEYESNIIIEISDNAGGIPEDILPNIWDAYFSTKDKNGTGIGLYMTRILVEKHLKGTIEAFNRDGGAVFTITVPIKV
jgi:signal transduction histidine kinase